MQNLKKLRLERKLSQQKLAEQFGITQQAIYNYENGITEPDIYMLKRMAEFFHTSIDYLVGRIEDPAPYDEHRFLVEFNTSKDSKKQLDRLSMYSLYLLYGKLSKDMQNRISGMIEEIAALQSAKDKIEQMDYKVQEYDILVETKTIAEEGAEEVSTEETE